MNLVINEELRNIIPPLTTEELEALEKSILRDGIREPLVVWGKVIVDGHNRFEICEKHGIIPELTFMDFDSVDDAKIWMIDNQMGRRNLNDGQKYLLVSQKREILLEKGRQKMSEAAFIQQLKSDDKPIQGLSETGKPSQPKVEPHNFRGVTKMVGLTVAAFGNVYLINIFLLRSPRPPPCVTLLSDMEWGNWSDSEIARKAAVTHPYVAKLRTLCVERLSCNGYKITPDNPEVTPRSFFGATLHFCSSVNHFIKTI